MSEFNRLTTEPAIGDNCRIENSKLGQYTRVGIFNHYENVILGDYSYTSEFCILQNVEIGKFSNIAAMVRIGPTNHPMERPTLHHFTYRRMLYGFDDKDDAEFFEHRKSRKTYIGHDTWIGHGAIIMPEVTIGNGAVVGSGAIVTKDVEAYSVVVGSPAKPIRKRFDDITIKKLEAIEWWNWSYEKVKENFNDFLLDIHEFINKHYEGR
ncbi:streptogramin A acetyltransferase [Oxobacter pfennigii]|uniref:Streptogramin A acetyltransferase n=1 Tax=Oxobacter pfennigii TaxID=36849 RepID=A0A0P8W4W4_9CLOT|nr:DapH/DapD/GlmU-related protein [Oxobacter pfennigii]KPU42587.1 streptogramin A acetyltransferase [Oxobacter pfennigii]